MKKRTLQISVALLAAVGIFLLGHPAAAAGEWAATVVIWLSQAALWALNMILILVIQALLFVASIQEFTDSQAVILGWVIVRDICNMFFVVVLMVIAFGTILNIPDYSYKKWLPKLVLFAVLINFSKTICGLLIDISQVVMLTFVNAFKDIGGANLVNMLGISDIVTLNTSTGGSDTDWAIAGAYVLGVIYLLIALVVIATMVMILVMRLIMIWIYIVLSPAAYLLAAVPGGQKYSSQWWDEFIKNLIVGPVLAFFIWLSLAALGTSSVKSLTDTTGNAQSRQEIAATTGKDISTIGGSVTKGATASALIKFVIAIGMLVGGLMVSQQIGGAAGSLAGKGMSKIQKGAAFAGGLATGAAMLPLKGLKAGTSGLANYGVDKLHQKTGVDLNLKRAWAGVQNKRKEIKEKRYAEGQIAAGKAMSEGGRLHGILAMTGNSADAWEQSTSLKGIAKRLKGGKRMAKNMAVANADKDRATTELGQLEYERKWMDMSPEERQNERKRVKDERDYKALEITEERSAIAGIDKQIKEENDKGDEYKDIQKIENLTKEKAVKEDHIKQLSQEGDNLQRQRRFIEEKDENGNYINDVGRVYTNSDRKNKEEEIGNKKEEVRQAGKRVEKNIPDYNFEARAAEQHVISKEISKIKDISDSDELLRILQDAISSRDKTLVKAITLKMSKDGNDNEFLRPLAGRTDHVGLKSLMRQFSDKNSDNYCGFSEQEAFGLGSQIAELNKGTNHWGATGAYVIDNGKWRETTNEEHHKIRDVETGKQQLQAFIRNNNRLAYGFHDKGGDFHIDAGGIIKLKAIDNVFGHKNIDTMNENAASYIYKAIMDSPKLKAEFSRGTGAEKKDGTRETLIEVLEKRLGSLREKGKFEDKYNEAVSLGE